MLLLRQHNYKDVIAIMHVLKPQRFEIIPIGPSVIQKGLELWEVHHPID